MILRPRLEDIKVIGFYLGKIIIALGFTMVIPILFALSQAEMNPVFDFIIGIEITLIIGLILTKLCATEKDLNWMQGMIVVSLSWLAAMIVAAIPLY
ncbi:MAG: hypothetical protein PHY94_06040, partial [Candidatus Omnitrophica bacterium]|nr:hypothetical protein [Candidatus Omnitrophota bacterium]